MTTRRTSVLVWLTFVVIGGGSANRAFASDEIIPPNIAWEAGNILCQPPQASFPTPQAAVQCLIGTNTMNVIYTGALTPNIQFPPHPPASYWAGANVWSNNPNLPPIYTFAEQANIVSANAPCPTGYIENPVPPDIYNTTCIIHLVLVDKSQKPCDHCVGNPIYPGTGNKRQEEVDFIAAGPTPLMFSRIYNSASQFGSTWKTTYSRSVSYSLAAGIQVATINRPDGSYSYTANGLTWVPDADTNYKLIGGPGGFTVYTPEGDFENYDAKDQLSSVYNLNGTAQKYALTYSADAAHLLTKVSDAFGHSLNLTYDAQNRLATMTDPSGGLYQYGYDANSNLTSVTYPDTKVRTYVYDEAAYTAGIDQPHALTGIIDENSTRYANFGYSASGLAVLSEHAGGVERYSVAYATEPTVLSNTVIDIPNNIKYVTRLYQAPTGAVVTDALGQARQYTYTVVNGIVKTSTGDKPCSGPCTPVPQSQTYDANGNVTSKTDFKGNLNCYAYDLTRNLETVRVEGFASGNVCPASLAAYTPIAGTRQRNITTTWNATFRVPATITEANRSTAYTYDGAGNMLTKTVTDTAAATTRVWTNTYTSAGQVLTADGPRTDVADVTTSTYYFCTGGFQCGLVNTITNAAGQVTTYNTYNANGQPLTITDPNGVVTTLTYDLRQRLMTRQVGTEATMFDYYPTGLLQKATLPDSSFVQYTYDPAHRLTAITDGLGNKISYTLDAMGNRTAESAFDPFSVLSRTRSRAYNTMSQLTQEIGSAGTAAVTTTFGYDTNGNQTSINAPLARNTTNQYDELNRLKQITDPATGNTVFGYDANDNLTSVLDPSTLTTSYTYNGFGDLATQVSPQTGTTINAYDTGGNLATSLDARNNTATYSYDALNRVTQVAYGDQTIAYSYDAGTNGKGRLTGASDSNHSMSWAYDGLGRVTSKSQSVSGVTLTTGYSFTTGQMTTLSTPSGQSVVYAYANGQTAGITVNGAALISNVLYEPFGPARGWTWGNATIESRLHDTDGNPSLISGVEQTTYTVDSAFRITGLSNASTSAASWTYGYDVLDRLTSATAPSAALSLTYDAVGNRQGQIGGAPPAYLGGNITLTYDKRNRLVGFSGANSATYVYNALGQRIQKTGTAATLFAYDEAGHLLGEYTNGGALIQETVWLGDIPVATLRPHAGGGVDIYYVHVDHLSSPKMITRASDNVVMWRWDQDPFGTAAPNANPAGQGAFVYNLRFPGQYYDSETGLNYNYFRDYDSVTGRYVESDPIGLKGGTNTYTYVGSSPVRSMDPQGLLVMVIGHSAGGPLGRITNPNSYHSALYLKPDDPCKCSGTWPVTLGAQDIGENLVGTPNYPGDAIANAQFRKPVTAPAGISDCDFIRALISAAASYSNNLAYSFPFISILPREPDGFMAPGQYNSNSFVSGVLQSVGATPPSINTGGQFQLPGYQNPVPLPRQ